jgi:hypothetical protein
MSVATKNPFAILDGKFQSDNPHRPSSFNFLDQLSEPSLPAEPPAEPTQVDVPPQNNNRPNQKSRGGPAARGGKYYARGGKPSSLGDEPAAAAAVDDSQKKGIFSLLPFISLSNFTQPKVVEAGASEVGVAVKAVVKAVVMAAVEKVAVDDVRTTSTVKLAKRTFSPYSLSLLLTSIPATPTRRFIKAGVATMAMPN